MFSFYATKTMTTGEGGMITTRDPAILDRVRTMRLHGIDRDAFRRDDGRRPTWEYDVIAPGFKYNLSDPAAAMGRVQLRRVAEMHARRCAIVQRYRDALAGLPLRLPSPAAPDTHAWHLFIVQLCADAPVTRDEFVQGLADRGVQCSVHFIPLHRLTYWREHLGATDDHFPVASANAGRVVSLPLFSSMSDDQTEQVVAAIRDVLA